MSTDVASSDDAHYAKQLAIVTLVWLLLIFGSGMAMIFMLPD